MEMLMVTVEDSGTYAFETADGVKMALAMGAWKDAALGVVPVESTAPAFDPAPDRTKRELKLMYLSSEALSSIEGARRTSVVGGRRVSAPVLITRMVEGSGRGAALGAPASIAEEAEEGQQQQQQQQMQMQQQAKRRDSEQFEM
jgi:hypothetical protein